MTPVPEAGRARLAFVAVLAIAKLPVTVPDDWGANRTVKVVLCPAFRVSGRLRPLMAKPVPVVVA